MLLGAIGRFVRPGKRSAASAEPRGTTSGKPGSRSVAVLDPEQIRAAVTVALDSAMPALIDQVTERGRGGAIRPQVLRLEGLYGRS